MRSGKLEKRKGTIEAKERPSLVKEVGVAVEEKSGVKTKTRNRIKKQRRTVLR
ncbi:hypothetical protein Hanom_Chr00s119992g01811171 [Helianthus anomalus]